MRSNKTTEQRNLLINKIELKSTEVQDVMGRMPSAVIRMGQGVIFIIFLVMCLVVLFLKYSNYTIIRSKISNVNFYNVIYAKTQGKIYSIHHKYGDFINRGDTLCVIEKDDRKQFIISPSKGYIFAFGEMQEGNYIDSKTCLCVITDTIYATPISTFYVTKEQVDQLRIGMLTEGQWEYGQLEGSITQIVTYPNPQTGKYIIKIQWNQLDIKTLYPFYEKEISIKLHLSDMKIWENFFYNKRLFE